MSEVKFGNTLSLEQAAKLIVATPMNRYLLQGEPGIGKSSILEALGEMLPTHDTAYIDVPALDLGDTAMPVIERETRTTTYFPNGRFKLHTGKPVIIMLDEFTKATSVAVKNMLHPLLESKNPRLGDLSIHPESIIFLTGNLTSDGVGDSLQAHTRNRIIPIHIAKPSALQWIKWAVNNYISPVVIAWVNQTPHCLESYTTSPDNNNPYNYHPKSPQKAFISPRSLERMSNIIKEKDKVDEESLLCGLAGAGGEAGARDMQAFIEYQDQLPTWEAIVKHPESTIVPTGAGACSVLIFGAVLKVDKDTIVPFMKYLERFEAEWQACFAITLAQNPVKKLMAYKSKTFIDWIAKNEDLL
jgi:hypothetical protein